MDTKEVSIQEFQADVATFAMGGAPIAVTQDGKTVGYFIPARVHDAADLAALEVAGHAIDKAIGSQDIDIEEAVAEFDTLRRKSNRRKTSGPKAA